MGVIQLTPRRWWWALLLLFAAHQVLQKGLNISIPWADAYLDNLLCMPLLLGFWQWERRRLWGAPPLRAWEIVLATLLFAFLFEWAFPVGPRLSLPIGGMYWPTVSVAWRFGGVGGSSWRLVSGGWLLTFQPFPIFPSWI